MVQKINPHPAPGCKRSPLLCIFKRCNSWECSVHFFRGPCMILLNSDYPELLRTLQPLGPSRVPRPSGLPRISGSTRISGSLWSLDHSDLMERPDFRNLHDHPYLINLQEFSNLPDHLDLLVLLNLSNLLDPPYLLDLLKLLISLTAWTSQTF